MADDTPRTVEEFTVEELRNLILTWLNHPDGFNSDCLLVDALIAAVRAEEQAALMAERPTEPLKLNLYGRACYRAGQQSVRDNPDAS